MTDRHLAPALLAGAATTLVTALTLGHAANATAATIPTADTVVGVGGWRNPTSDRIPDKFQGALVPAGQPYLGVPYPAELPVDPSVAAGQQPLRDAVGSARPDGSVLVVGYSEGSLVAERFKRGLVAGGAPADDDLDFLFIAAPFVPNGGIYSRFPGVSLPGFTNTGAAAPSPYDETFVTLEYDLIADFPAYANPLSLANALAGLVYVHGDQGPDNVDLATAPTSVKVVESEAGGRDTYILVRAEHLPLLQPVRDVSSALGATAVTEPVLGAVEPGLRELVDMGYTDRDYRNADQPTPFRLVTPPKRIAETAAALAGAGGAAPSSSTRRTERDDDAESGDAAATRDDEAAGQATADEAADESPAQGVERGSADDAA